MDQPPRRSLGRALLLVGAAILAHAGYSIYELQVVLRESGGHFSPLNTTATPQAFLGLLIMILGISFTATPFKQISWESEMCSKTVDQMSYCPGFVDLASKAGIQTEGNQSVIEATAERVEER